MKTYVIWVFDNILCMNLVKTWVISTLQTPKPQVRPRVAPLSLIPIFHVRYFALLVVFLQHVNGSPTCVHKSCTAQQIALIWNRLPRTNSSFCSLVKDRQMPPTVLYVKVNLHRAAIHKGFPPKFPISTCSVNRTLHDRNKVIGCPFIAVEDRPIERGYRELIWHAIYDDRMCWKFWNSYRMQREKSNQRSK